MSKGAFRLLDDRPLDEAGRKRFGERRLDPVIGTLQGLLKPSLAAKVMRGQSTTPPRIGLIGGLGQGKSTVLRCCLERLEQETSTWQRLKNRLLGRPVARFDVSFFKTDDLEWRFVSAVLWRRIFRNFVWQGGVLLLLLLGLVCLIPLLEYWSVAGCFEEGYVCLKWLRGVSEWEAGWILGSFGVLAALKVIWSFCGKGLEFSGADHLYLAYWDLLVQWLARFTSALPQVVVIDDLDRALVEQQRSFLRAMSRFSRELDFAVVVCMDDSELLAAPPNPEAPEELLRKTLTDELRLPDRSREDVAILVMSFLRELVEINPESELKPALSSVQFVADVTRVLLLAETQVPPIIASPRKINRMLARVVRHAEQLGVTQTDDLSALLRIDGFFQLVPGLRRRLDDLRKVLESNRDEAACALLESLGLDKRTEGYILRYFRRTAMMQPISEDGWFKLLGGFAPTTAQADSTRQSDLPWSASWELGDRSHDLFRLFLDGVGMSTAGYRRNLALADWCPASGGEGSYVFEKNGGGKEHFKVSDLPKDFLGQGGAFLGQGWVCWICAIATSNASDKAKLFEKAYAWCSESGNINLRRLFWRECLADRECWEGMSEVMRDLWWSRADQENPALPIEYFFARPLSNNEFSESWRILVKSNRGEIREARRVLHWWQSVAPVVRAERLLGGSDLTKLASRFWPAPSLNHANMQFIKEELLVHVKALNCINAQRRQAVVAPAIVLDAWRSVQDCLGLAAALDILFALARDAEAKPGLRWGWRSTRLWLDALDEEQLKIFCDVIEGRSALPDELRGSEQRCLTLLWIAALQAWQPTILRECSWNSRPLEKDLFEAGEVLGLAGLRPAWWPG